MNNTSYQYYMVRNNTLNMYFNIPIIASSTFEGILYEDTDPIVSIASIYDIDIINTDVQNVTDGVTFSNINTDQENFQLNVSTSYSTSGTTLAHILTSYNDTTVLNWVSLDPVNKFLTLNTTNVTGTYALYLETEGFSYHDQNLITIQVVNCTVQNCRDCQSGIDA